MRIDITSLCFGFKIEKENDSGTPAWATSIGQAPKDICYIDTKIDGLSNFIYGMMYKSHSDFEKLKDRDIPGLDKREEPRSKRDRMMFSVFEKVFVNGKKVDGIYTLTYEKEHSQNHENRLHICYAKYLTYDGHSNKTTLAKMAEVLGCNEDACWFVDDITIRNQSELHFHAFVVNPNHNMTYASSKQRQKEWERIANGNYKVLFGPTKYGTNKFNYPSLLKEALHLLVNNRPDLFESSNDVFEVKGNKAYIAKCQVGWDKNTLEGVRVDKYDESFSWVFNGMEYVPNKELTGPGLKGFVEVFNSLLDKQYGILTDEDDSDNYVYTIIQYLPHESQDKVLKGNLQQIFYGAPGTGKSNEIKRLTGDGTFSKNYTFRTTFHPDFDYSTFVGAYKPIWDKDQEKIVYDFRPQSFLKAYVAAWTHPSENVALVIEEINRGNCAQIFGDIFQLLDRENDGLSKYPIESDIDMKDFLSRAFSGEIEEPWAGTIPEDDKENINEYYSKHYDDAFAKIDSGEILTLPKNLSILATMNTSDQSLFPMDSAFKRRWEWQYMPIVSANKDWKIQLHKDYEIIDWWEFLELINNVISDLTTSEDKQLGYFFCQPDGFVSPEHAPDAKPDLISAKCFVDKVIFYLWNDVFKDYAFDAKCCKDKDGKEVLFAKFYNKDGKSVNIETLKHFFESLTVDNKPSLVKEIVPTSDASGEEDANVTDATSVNEEPSSTGNESVEAESSTTARTDE